MTPTETHANVRIKACRTLPVRGKGPSPPPLFNAAVAAMDGGDLPGLRKLLKEAPELVRARGNLEPPYDYFTAATLLHHTFTMRSALI